MILFISCQSSQEEKEIKKKIFNKENLIKVNKNLIKKDKEIIESYVKRRNWKMEVTQTGLWFMIYFHGEGRKAKEGKIATINFSVELLDGTLCYSSDSLNPKLFRIGQGGVESGLEEGILLLREGDKARFIMPPHLAHHLLGDENKIPPRSTIIYDLELIKISGI